MIDIISYYIPWESKGHSIKKIIKKVFPKEAGIYNQQFQGAMILMVGLTYRVLQMYNLIVKGPSFERFKP